MTQTMHIVYLASHPSHGEYVGTTTMGLAMRESTHWSASRKNKNSGLHSSLRETNREEWDWTILHFVLDDEKKAYRLEREEIESRTPALNNRRGGAGGGEWINPTKEKFGRANVGKTCPDHVKEKLSAVHSTRRRSRKFSKRSIHRLHKEGLSQETIANTLGCTQSHVSRTLN